MSLLSRRTVLSGAVGGVALLAAGCSTDAIPVIGGTDPDDDLRRLTAESELELIAAYDSAIAARPGLAKELGRIRTQHQQHLNFLLEGLDPLAEASPGPTVGAGDAIRVLRRLERGAARQRAAACVVAEDPVLTQVLARIGASESAHAAFLATDVRLTQAPSGAAS